MDVPPQRLDDVCTWNGVGVNWTFSFTGEIVLSNHAAATGLGADTYIQTHAMPGTKSDAVLRSYDKATGDNKFAFTVTVDGAANGSAGITLRRLSDNLAIFTYWDVPFLRTCAF